MLAEELEKIKTEIGTQLYSTRCFQPAAKILDELVTDEQFVDFLTLPAYHYLA
jgi:malate synthase